MWVEKREVTDRTCPCCGAEGHVNGHYRRKTDAHVSGSGQVEPKRSIEGGGATGRATFALDRLKVQIKNNRNLKSVDVTLKIAEKQIPNLLKGEK